MEFEFISDHWSIIKEYAGIYSITTKWDLTKLDNNEIDTIIGYIPRNKNIKINCEDRIKYIWNNIDKSKLFNVYDNFKSKLNVIQS